MDREKTLFGKILANWQLIFMVVMIVVFFSIGIKRGVLVTTGNDFTWHLNSGKYALSSAENGGGIQQASHYSPGRIAFNAVLSYFSEPAAKGIIFAIGWSGFLLALYLWNSMADAVGRRLGRKTVYLANAITYLLLAFYIVRDLDDCGLQMILLALLVVSGWLLFNGYKISSGITLALAVTWKSAPLLFLPFLIYKRQWKASAALIVGIAFFNLVPSLLIFGKAETERQWIRIGSMFVMSALNKNIIEPEELEKIAYVNTGPEYNTKDPRRNAVEPARNQNQALKHALGRYLIHSDQSDLLYITTEGNWRNDGGIGESLARQDAPPHPLWKQFLNLPVELAGKVANGVILCLGLLIAWRFRKAWRTTVSRERKVVCDNSFLPEWSVACIFTAILSPLCWLHHLVLIIPAVILIMREVVYYGKEWGIWRWCCLVYLLIPAWAIERDFIGKELSIIALSYKFHTIGALLIILLVLNLKDRAQTAVCGGDE